MFKAKKNVCIASKKLRLQDKDKTGRTLENRYLEKEQVAF